MDITYVSMARGFVYLAGVIDWFSRSVLSWRRSITMKADFCVEALEEAMVRQGRPEIFNMDQGSQFSGHAFTSVLRESGIAISMDGRGAWRDNVFVERLWRPVKYEEIYLQAYDTVSAARAAIDRYLAFYNWRRPHSSFDRRAPRPRLLRQEAAFCGSLNLGGLHLFKSRSLLRQSEPRLSSLADVPASLKFSMINVATARIDASRPLSSPQWHCDNRAYD